MYKGPRLSRRQIKVAFVVPTRSPRHKSLPVLKSMDGRICLKQFCFVSPFLFFLADRLRRRRRRRCYYYDDARLTRRQRWGQNSAATPQQQTTKEHVEAEKKKGKKAALTSPYCRPLSLVCLPYPQLRHTAAVCSELLNSHSFPTSQVARIWKKPKGTEDSFEPARVDEGGCATYSAMCVSVLQASVVAGFLAVS